MLVIHSFIQQIFAELLPCSVLGARTQRWIRCTFGPCTWPLCLYVRRLGLRTAAEAVSGHKSVALPTQGSVLSVGTVTTEEPRSRRHGVWKRNNALSDGVREPKVAAVAWLCALGQCRLLPGLPWSGGKASV